MKFNFQNIIKFSTALFIFGFLFIGNVNRAEAAVRTWTGTNSGAWSIAANWGGTAPVTGDDLVFPNGASNLSNTNDLTENTIFNSITLSGSGYTLSGNPLILGAGLAGITDSVSSGGNTINLYIRLDVTRDIIVTNTTETLTISGKIAGVGGINKEGNGKLVLSGANTYGGVTKINEGVINAQNDDALGTITAGTEVVGGAALELQGTINISYEPLVLRGYGVSGGGALRNISNSNTFGGLITLTSAAGTEISSDSGTLTIAGGVTGAFPLVIDGASNTTFSTTPIATAGITVTKNGAGTLTYNFPNTYTGLTTINAGKLLYGVDNAILSGNITVTGGILDIATFSDMVGTVTLGTLDLASGTITGSTGMLSATGSTATTGWVVYNGTISAIIAGDATTLTKTTPGTVTLTRANQYTGATTVSLGILEIQDSNALGLIDGITTVTAGATLQINGNGSNLSIPEYITFSGTGHLYTSAIRNKQGNNTLTGLLTLGAAATIDSDSGTTLTIDTKGLSATTLGLTIGGAGNTTFTSAAPIYGTSATLTKNDTGILTIQSFSNFTGVTTINRGQIVLNGAGAIPLSTITVNSGGILTLDNSSTTILNRISDSAALTLNDGIFNFLGNASGAAYETAGALTPASGHSIVTVTPGAGGSTTMTFASFARTTGASVLFRGTSFGTAAAANVSTLLFTTAPVSPALAGAAGAANTTTASILKGAFGDNSLSGTGTDMVTYNLGNTNGLRLLNGAGFSGEYSTTLTTNTNVKLTADVAASTVNINSLILNGFNITNPGSPVTVTISNGGSLSGNILINSATNIAGANTTIGITTSELNILATASSTISAIIGTATTGSLTLSGPGNVTLSAANPFTGLTSVNDATLTYGTSNILSSGGVTIVGGTLAMGTSSDTVGAVILQNGSITGSSGILTGASYSFREGTVSAIIAGAVTVTVIATNAAPDAVVTLSGSNTYTGATTVTSGILKLGATGDATNTPLGTTDAGTTIASGAMLDLNGFTLGTAEGLTISGSGIGSGLLGALMNSSASTPTYSGAIILGAAARISADAGVMTISGGISSGGAFTITIGGFSDSTFSGALTTGSLTKDGIGTLTLSNGNSSYPGTTTINAGTIKLGAVSVGGTNSPLGTIGGITTVAIGARLDLNGINLGIAEPLTINGVGYGLGDFASGALINSSPSAVIFSGPTTMASASTIKANSGDITLSGANSGAFALTLGGTGNGILSGTIASSAATVTKIDTGTWTLSGASNAYTGTTSINLGTLKIGAAGVTTSPLGTVVGTTVYSGAVLNLNGFALGIAEALTLNGRGINDGGALINSGGATTFLGAITLGTDSRITNSGSGLLTLSGGVTNGGFALYVGGTNSTTFNTVAISGTGSLVKQDSGTVTNNVSSTYTGATRIDAGTFAYGASGLLAVTNVAVTGGIWDMGTIADSVGTVTLIGGTIQNGTLTGTGYTLENGTISAILAGAIAVVKNTNNTVTLTNANTISSTTTINAGTLTLSGVNGTAVSTTITVNYGGTLTLDNSGSGNSNTNRLGDLALTMNGGNFNFLGSANAVASETWATQSLVLNSGHNVVTLTSGAGGSTTVTFAGITRTAAGGATVLFRGTNLGSNAGAGNTNLIFTTATNLNLTGGAGAAGSATIKIVPYAMGDTSATGTGFGFVTYNIDTNGNVNGIRPLTLASEYDNTNTPATSSTTNVRLTANYAPNANRDWNSLLLEGGVTYTVGSNASRIMTITSGAIGSTGAANTITGGATDTMAATATVTEFKTQLVKDLTISVVIANTNTPALTLGFGGTLTLSKANLNSGITTINTGKLYYGITDALLSGNVFIVGGTLDMTGGTYTDTIGALSLNAGTVATGASTLTGNGSFTTIANNNVASIITGKLGLGNNATFTIADGTTMDNDAVISAVISGAFTFAKAGTGVLEVSGSNTYSGATTISAGIFRLGATGDATNTPLGTIAAGTTVSGATSALDLNGFSLGTAEALTLSGAWANGALQNNSSAPVNYSGLITLGAASTIISNYGDINITNTGNITGATFALTIGGAGNGTLVSNLNTTTGTLTKNGLGLWIIGNASTGLSTFTGLTTISAGTLKLGYGGNGTNTPIGTNAGGITISTTGIFDLNGFTLGTAEPIGSLNGTGIANIGAFINSSNNSITYTGAITMAANSTIANYGSGVLTLTGAISGSFALTVVTVGGVTQSSASVWSGTGTLVKQGSGTLILAGQNTMTGAMTVSTGVLQLGADGTASSTSGPLGSIAGGVTVSSGAVLDLSTFTAGGLSTWEPLTLSGSGDLNGGALISNSSTGSTFATVAQTNARVVNNGSGTLAFTAAVTGASTFWVGGTGPTTISGALNTAGLLLTKYGSGTLTLSNASNINTSLVRINGGKLAYGVADALSTPAVTVAGGIWDLNGWNETNIGAVTLIDGSIVNTGVAATLTSTATSVVENGTISAVLGSAVAAGIAKNTAGRVTISGNNTFTSTSIALNAGYLNLQNSNALGASGTTLTTTISAGATLELQNNITLPSTKLITANGTGVNNTGAIRNVADSNTIGANITLGTTNVRINSDSGTLSFPTISGGTFNLIFGGASNISVTGIISTTSGTLTKDGAGTLTLSGVNTYTGTTTIIGGIINANLTTALGDGSVTNTLIFNGGTLQAAGTIISPSNRTVILASGGGTIDTNGNSVSIAGTVGQAGGLTETGAGTLTISGVTTLGGDLTISSGTFVAPASLTIKGNFSNSGTFTHNNGTVTLVSTNSTKTTNIIGSSNTTFYNLTDTTAGSTLQLKAGNTYTFTNILTLTGSNGNPISINSDTPSAQWLMTLSGSSSISYVKVKDSGCNGGNNVGASSNIYDYGNNGTCWSFISAAYYGGGSGSVESPSTPDTQNGSGSGGGAGGGNDGSGTPDTQNGGGSNGGAGGGDLGFIYSTRDLVFIDKPSSTLDCLLM